VRQRTARDKGITQEQKKSLFSLFSPKKICPHQKKALI
jgi:hypothetical protein